MAANVIDWVWRHSKATNAALIVLLAIAHEAGRDGNAQMSVKELAVKCHLSERAAHGALAVLVALGDLEVTSGGGRGRSSRYRVTLLNPAESAPFKPVNPAESAPFTGNPAESAPFEPEGNPAESAPFSGRSSRPAMVGAVNPAESAGLRISDMYVTTTGTSEVQVKDVSEKTLRPDVARLCSHLADRIEANGSKRPATGKKWHDAARLMLDRDGRTEEQIHRAIDWCQDSEFWRSNILSMAKLRDKYEQLRLQAARPAQNGGGHTTTKDRVRQAAEAGRRVQAMLNGES